MGNVNININGTSSGGGSGTAPQPTPPNNPTPSSQPAQPNISGSGSSQTSGQTPIQPDSRLIEEVRRAIIAQGAVFVPGNNTYKPIINQVEQAQRKLVDESVEDKYNDRRTALNSRWDSAIEAKNKELLEGRNQELQGVTDPNKIKKINAKWDQIEDAEIAKLSKSFQREEQQIDKEQEVERLARQEELTQVMKDLTDAINKSGSLNPNSYLGQLRAERQQAIFERDTAEDEETANEAAQRVRDIDQKIKDTTDGRVEERGIDWGQRTLQTMLGFDQLARGITNKDLGSIMMGGAQTMTSMFGASDETAAKTLAWIKPLATVGTLFTQEGQRSDQMAGLAALIRGNQSIEDSRTGLYKELWNYSPIYNDRGGLINPYGINALGMSVPEFSQSAERRISQRMSVQDGVSEAYFQEALERVFSLNRGSLGEAGKYDRYGVNVTDAFSSLIGRLESISGSGISQGNYVRAQEYLSSQQGMMEYYKRYSNKPDYYLANNDIAGLSRLSANNPNYTFDDRSVGEIQSLNSQLTNPKNDRMKAILYGVVEEEFKDKTYNGQKVAGRSDLIDQILHDPKEMGKVRTAYMDKLTNMYGGTDSPLGYWMAKSQTGMENPERMIELWNGFSSGGKGVTLREGETERRDSGHFANSQKEEYSKQVANYVSDMTKTMINMSDVMYAGVDFLQEIANDLKSARSFLKNIF